eukprot:CAMPEP_0201487802 /NCGR_PEP_ID=MMETSP0151_2-20130828/15396_1 /ASSEMBLY_ACC=CAM_ASM_000257 /TAXON_ID=200890 /ORGANISM="Paramoeba atlantica, Strain 621/1 / CCAP 1560/9" /LENGTH=233 /DNA_ID=CAMNT_0047872953 /DNA_START=54 /DNA_END=755 /DNA_ORIENTATION=+
MKSYVFCLVCLMCLGVKSQSAPDPPIYPNTTISKFTWLDLIPDPEEYGSTGTGVTYYDYNAKRIRTDLTIAGFPISISVFEFYENSTQYTVTRGGDFGTVCDVEDVDQPEMPPPDALATSCAWGGLGEVNMKKVNMWGCQPIELDDYSEVIFLWTEMTPLQDPVRQTVTLVTNGGNSLNLGTLVYDLSSVVDQTPANKEWQVPKECFSRKREGRRELSQEENVLQKILSGKNF